MKKTLKVRIRDVLKTLPYSFAYAQTPAGFPAIRYSLLSNVPVRTSNIKHYKNISYQLDVFTQIPLDVEDETNILTEIEQALEQAGLYTSNWLETEDPDNHSNMTIYHYFITIRS